MRKIFTWVILLLLANTLKAQSYFVERFLATDRTNEITTLAAAPNNHVIMAGSAQGEVTEAFIGELNSSGDLLWNKQFEFGNGGATGVCKTNDGGYALLTSDNYFIKLNSRHAVQFIKKIYISNAGYLVPNAFVQADDNGYAITGMYAPLGSSQANMFLFKIDSAGNYQWNKDILTYSESYSMSKTKTGGYLLTGSYKKVNRNGDMCVVKTDGSGNVIFSEVIKSGGFYSRGRDVIETSDGGCLAVGETSNKNKPTHSVNVKLNAAGSLQWSRVFQSDAGGYFASLRVLPDKNHTNSIVGILSVPVVSGSSAGYEALVNISDDGKVNKRSITVLDSSLYFVGGACRGENRSIWFGTYAHTYAAGYFGSISKSDKDGNNCTIAKQNITETDNTATASLINEVSVNNSGHVLDGVTSSAGNENGAAIVKLCEETATPKLAANAATKQLLPAFKVITVYPNPASSIIHINGLSSSATSLLSITDVAGKLLATTEVSGAFYNWNIATLNNGIYLLTVVTNNKTTTLKFVKQ